MKKIVGIVSCYFKNNYGSVLQAYATKRILDKNNIANETINIDKNIDFKIGKIKFYFSQIFNFNFIKQKYGMIKLRIYIILKKDLKRKIRLRNNKFQEFRKEFNLSLKARTYKELNTMSQKRYSDIIVGSDQLWLPINIIANYYTLNWVPEEINKISYSTSFGISSIPKKYHQKYKYFLKRLNHISVRELEGVNLVKNLTNIDAQLVCDPTILLTKEEWNQIASKNTIINDKYILCYFLGNNIEHRKFAERLKEKTGLKIVSLNHADEYVKYSEQYADIIPYNIGPREWLNLIKNADYICTDSFHGTVFSLLFNKRFFNFRRYSSKIKEHTNTRLDSLLTILDVSNKFILTGNEDIEEILQYKIDYNKVNSNLELFRKKSQEWLLSSLTYKEKEGDLDVE